MIKSDAELATTQEALRHLEQARAALEKKVSPELFKVMSEDYDSNIERLKAEIARYFEKRSAV